MQRVEEIVVKGQNACYQHFLRSPQGFHIILYQGRLNSGLFGTGLKNGRLRAKNCLRSLESFK